MTMIEREPELLLLFMEFWAYGVRDPQVRPKVAARFAQMRQVLTQLIADGVREFDLELAMPGRAAGGRDRRARRRHRPPEARRPRGGAGRADGQGAVAAAGGRDASGAAVPGLSSGPRPRLREARARTVHPPSRGTRSSDDFDRRADLYELPEGW